ncbi:PREDICTED: ADP-ribosylation factor-binding protein GGA1 [Dufourea novaeangliae]|uniref:ADP-ribosylation factor-binding protein GGA1 n=1 Tax=Dufourea novaeangliae TaxID=178035 RepID=A0A154P5A2_DUFNO|nr:PREDICTED: ADP-ribosylation factor-binding protein GGA1 [Dufourea novaeangliae]KZC06358.1 ADP-ribosylation factor-binding protein GGA1 [Dufourea novaeangliae]
MDVVTTSLEALIQRVTNPQNQKPDVPATEAFCVMITKEPEGIQIGTKLLALHIQSSNESEALQALALLDTCMRRCGSSFHAEIGKFRFLNEMIRLVSPKYLGGKTPVMVRHKVLQLLHVWTKEYPREVKIKEAYEMLKKQGVVEDDSLCTINASEDTLKMSKTKHTIFDDEEKSKLLQKLLQSKNPDDLQAANRLIKTMVREDERRVQLNSRRIMELESVHNNAKLLSEMLDSYNCNETSGEDLELMKELRQACERLKPIVLRLANETQDNEEMLGDVLAASDELGQVFEKYSAIIVHGERVNPKTDSNASPYLLDLSSPIENNSVESNETTKDYDAATTNHQSDMEVLGDIFNSLGKSESPEISSISSPNLLIPDTMIMQPISVQPTSKKGETIDTPDRKMDSKARALEELNELGESLLKQSLSGSMTNTRSNSTSKETVNSMVFPVVSEDSNSTPRPRNGSSHVSGSLDIGNTRNGKSADADEKTSMCGNSTQLIAEDTASVTSTTEDIVCIAPKIKPLTDINVSLQDIKPGINPPITVLEEKNGITVVLHFARDNPREDVFVVVITTMSKNLKPLNNYLFQAVVPKKCKCRLQSPSGTELPGHNPFLPPSAITQIMLIANPSKETVSLKFMLSYTMDDETFTEMGEVEKLPLL